MKTLRLFLLCLMVILPGVSSFTHAEDIDIYNGNAASSGVPNVLLVLDNAANFSANAASCKYVDGTSPTLNGTAGGIEQCALYNVISGLPDGTINLGLMVYNDKGIRDINGVNCDSANGGCLVQPLALMSGTVKANFLAWIKTWKTSESDPGFNIKASGEATGATMQEAWAYYAGSTGLSGRSYAGIKPTAGCQKNFVIFIGNAFNTSGTPSDTGNADPIAALVTAGATTAQRAIITIPSGTYGTSAFSCGNYAMGNDHGTKNKGLYADEWARYMYQTDIYGSLEENQGITTYTIGLLGSACKPDYPALLTSMAKVGGGKYFATSSYDEIATAILKILNEIQAVNSVFASASLPVSVNAQGTYLNQIFLGMFRPDASANPRWLGNLKQYQFVLQYPDPSKPDPNSAQLRLGDANGDLAISSAGTGFITSNATSFWTSKNTATLPDLTGGFFVNDPQGVGGAFDAPDGELVEKGGAAQRLRLENLTATFTATAGSASNPRRLYTYCPSGSGCTTTLAHSSNAFDSANSAITDALLNSTDSVSVLSIVRVGTTASVTTGVNHGFITGDSVIIDGASPAEYNGTKALINKISNTSFSFTVPEYPISPATGAFTVSISGAPKPVASITRINNLATVTLPGHGFVTGQSVTMAGATQFQYNGTFPITTISSDSFSYPVVEGPVTPAGSGTAKVGATSRIIASFDANNAGVTRAGKIVTVTTTANHGFANSGNVTIAGVLDPANNSPISEYNGVFSYTKTGNRSFTYPILATTPASPATGTITADGSTSPKTITSLTRNGAVVTASSAAHGFLAGQAVSIGGTPGTNEAGYIGTFTLTAVSTNSFTYAVTTTPVTPATGTIVVRKSGSSDRAQLIQWVRGSDNFGDEASPGGSITVRPTVHGDVLHSRPVIVNYGDSRGVVVYYGANDGVFRAVNGSKTGAIGSVPAGGELWGLVLPEHFGKLNRQRINTPELKMPSTVLPGAQAKDYFTDGAVGVYQKLDAGGLIDKAYLYLTMRRGGRFIYALDVSDPNSPKFMWKISSSDSDFSELGQSWSRPRATMVKGYANPVLVFGGGYDPAEDAEPPTANTMGRGIFVVDAVTGVLVWKAVYTADTTTACSGSTTKAACGVSGMNWGIPADISFVDRDIDGKTDRFYAADVGGNVWRVDLQPAAGYTPDKWQVTKFAALGCVAGPCTLGTTPRKFFFPPDVLPIGAANASGSYDAIMLGSGDREHPLKNTATGSAYNVVNRFYFLKDTITSTDASGAVTITEASLFDASSVPYNRTLKGYYTTLATGEKSVNASVTVGGTSFFGTNQPTPPSDTSCKSNLGKAKGYALNPFTAALDFTVYDGGGMPPTPTTGIVTLDVGGTAVSKPFCIGCGGDNTNTVPCNSAIEACAPGKPVPKVPRRTYWYKQ